MELLFYTFDMLHIEKFKNSYFGFMTRNYIYYGHTLAPYFNKIFNKTLLIRYVTLKRNRKLSQITQILCSFSGYHRLQENLPMLGYVSFFLS